MSMSAPSDRSDPSDMSAPSDAYPPPVHSGLILPHGGYRKLRSFQAALAVYDGTVIFCDRFIGRRSRTHDQMVQAARSGVQNIAEGSLASATSKKTELKLTGVARASLGELERDCEDFLRQRGLRQWAKDSPEALAVRSKYQALASDNSPACPRCGKPMVRRTAKKGPRAGQPFWGCSAYPDCTSTRPVPPSGASARPAATATSDPSDPTRSTGSRARRGSARYRGIGRCAPSYAAQRRGQTTISRCAKCLR